jgi:hypothetical protein
VNDPLVFLARLKTAETERKMGATFFGIRTDSFQKLFGNGMVIFQKKLWKLTCDLPEKK